MGLGFSLSLLFFMDQNISGAMVNSPENRWEPVNRTTGERRSTWQQVRDGQHDNRWETVNMTTGETVNIPWAGHVRSFLAYNDNTFVSYAHATLGSYTKMIVMHTSLEHLTTEIRDSLDGYHTYDRWLLSAGWRRGRPTAGICSSWRSSTAASPCSACRWCTERCHTRRFTCAPWPTWRTASTRETSTSGEGRGARAGGGGGRGVSGRGGRVDDRSWGGGGGAWEGGGERVDDRARWSALRQWIHYFTFTLSIASSQLQICAIAFCIPYHNKT